MATGKKKSQTAEEYQRGAAYRAKVTKGARMVQRGDKGDFPTAKKGASKSTRRIAK